jgi:hypothetical protein
VVERLSPDALLEEGVDKLLNPASTRRRAGRLLPELVAERLSKPVDAGDRLRWAARFVHHEWPRLLAEQAGSEEDGWPELLGGCAVAIELLCGRLPPHIEARLVGSRAHALWTQIRARYERYVLLLDEHPKVCRIFTGDRLVGSADASVVPTWWQVDGPQFRGRSHTLMVALIEQRLIPESFAPVAATGELDPDGQTVRIVEGLVPKAKVWFRRFPKGWLLSPPPGLLSQEDWDELAGARGIRRDEGQRSWVVGGSLAEIAAKLSETFAEIHAWDGRPISETGLAFPDLEWGSPWPKNVPFHDALLAAAVTASGRVPDAPTMRGILIIGAPGSGKSILSRQLERAFRLGVLGALGAGVRRSARELMADVAATGASDWAAVLTHKEPHRAALFAELHRTGRLVPIVDGLDELDPGDLRRLGELLRAAPGWWIVTGRPLQAILNALPPAWQLRIKDLDAEEGRRILSGLDRHDLIERLYGGGYSARPTMAPGFAELCRTPFHLTLVARVLHVDEDPGGIDLHTLYRRAFDGLLRQAQLDSRLTEREVRLLTSLLDTVVGELARTWMLSGARYLSHAAVHECLEDAGLSVSERVDTIRALEFGYLLAPAAGAWEFAHRTLAEWAAASAVHTRVRRTIRAVERERGTLDTAGRAAIEAAELAPFVGSTLAHASRWVQLLRFYAPFIVAPAALVAALVGPGTRARWRMADRLARWRGHREDDEAMDPLEPIRDARLDEVSAEWAFAVELITATPWSTATEAQAMWALMVRARIVGLLNERDRPGREVTRSRLELLSAAVGRHLPRTWEGLIALAVGARDQEASVRPPVPVLLEAVPAVRANAVKELLHSTESSERLLALGWFERHKLAPPSDVLLALLNSLSSVASECERALASLPPRWPTYLHYTQWPQHDEHEGERRPLEAKLHDTQALEKAVWDACHRTGVGIPWIVARARLGDWPRHLESGLLAWFGRPAEDTLRRGSSHDGEVVRRRVSLSRVLEDFATADEVVREGLAFYQEVSYGHEVVDRALHILEDEDDSSRRRLLEEYLKTMNWEVRRQWRHDEGPAGGPAKDLAGAVDRVTLLRRRLSAVVSALHDSRFDDVAGELWAGFAPHDRRRAELSSRFFDSGRWPLQLSVREILGRDGYYVWRFRERGWRPPHLAELTSLAAQGAGRERFTAICVLAQAQARDETLAMLSALPTRDHELAKLIHDHINHQQTWDDIPTEFLPPDVVAALPLGLRAERNVPGWRAELLAKLAQADDDFHSVANIAAKHGVRAALPFLAAMVDHERDVRWLADVIGQLCTNDDAHIARRALFTCLTSDRHVGGSRSWSPRILSGNLSFSEELGSPAEPSPWQRLLQFLRLEDLDHLAEVAVAGLADADIVEAIKGFGMPAFVRIDELHRAAAQKVVDLRAAEPPPTKDSLYSGFRASHRHGEAERPIHRAESTLEALGGILVAVANPSQLDLQEIVALAFRVAGGDVHSVYATPGPLGADFDDPSDMDWSSTQENSGMVQAMAKMIRARLDLASLEWPALRRLFRHPSESLRKTVFELAARFASPHEIITLALEALEGHARFNQTRWTGQTSELMLAGLHHGGTGSINVAIPDTADTLVGAVRARLNSSHRSVIEVLCRHDLPGFRALAARWAGELGPTDWADLVEPLFEDPQPRVMIAAVWAIRELAGATLAKRLQRANRAQWTTVHDVFLLNDLLAQRPSQSSRDDEETTGQLTVVPAELMLLLLLESADRIPLEELNGAQASTVFDSFPTLVERADRHLPGQGAVTELWVKELRAWTGHASPKVRAVARRLRCERRDLGRADLDGLLTAQAPLDRLSAAECLTRLGAIEQLTELRRFWMAAFRHTEHKAPRRLRQILGLTSKMYQRYSPHGELVGQTELQDRLLWALMRAPAQFAPMLRWIAHTIDTDPEDFNDTARGADLVRGTIRVVQRWGDLGAIALLIGMDAQKIARHYTFTDFVSWAGRRAARVRREVLRRAAAGGEVAQEVVDGWNRQPWVPELDLLEARVRAVFLET